MRNSSKDPQKEESEWDLIGSFDGMIFGSPSFILGDVSLSYLINQSKVAYWSQQKVGRVSLEVKVKRTHGQRIVNSSLLPLKTHRANGTNAH
ncbi:hypothetical protein TNCV_2529281 [Trichonephila clavipes]|nr:hypothetical protein TNCV_2529281 [Trichonephila clavipes]